MLIADSILHYCSHIEFEDSEEEAGDTVVTGGLRLGQSGDQVRGDTQGPGHTGGPRDQTRGQVRSGQTKMPADGLTSSISRSDFVCEITKKTYLCSSTQMSFPQFLEKN